jgi:hypothetical protein
MLLNKLNSHSQTSLSNKLIQRLFALLMLLVCSISIAHADTDKPKMSLGDRLGYLCMKYTQIEKTEVNQMIRDLKDTGYAVDDYFLGVECNTDNFAKTKTPILQLAAEAPCGRVEYTEIVHKYYAVKRKDPAMWQQIINTKNTNGETYLDYIEHLLRKNVYSTDESKACVAKLVSFACSTGAVYSKYPEKSCPAQ